MGRVLHVTLSLGAGGAERLVIDLCRGLRGEFEFAVCCLDEAGMWADSLRADGIAVGVLGRQPGFHPSLSRAIAQFARRVDATVLHCHEYTPFVYGTLAQVLDRRLNVVSTEHGRLTDVPAGLKRRLGTRVVTLLPARVFAVCNDLRGRLIEEGFPSRMVRVLHNGIDPGAEPTLESRVHARDALSLDHRALVVGAVGRLARVKNFGLIIEAAHALRLRGRTVHVVIVGEGPERASLEAHARNLGVTDLITLAGHRDDVRRLVPAFDVFVNSSNYEGVSLTILEAMAAGVPVVATAVGGTPEVVVDHVTGLLTPPRAAVPMAAAIESLVADRALAGQLGRAARARLVSDFHRDRMLREYGRAYREAGAA